MFEKNGSGPGGTETQTKSSSAEMRMDWQGYPARPTQFPLGEVQTDAAAPASEDDKQNPNSGGAVRYPIKRTAALLTDEPSAAPATATRASQVDWQPASAMPLSSHRGLRQRLNRRSGAASAVICLIVAVAATAIKELSPPGAVDVARPVEIENVAAAGPASQKPSSSPPTVKPAITLPIESRMQAVPLPPGPNVSAKKDGMPSVHAAANDPQSVPTNSSGAANAVANAAPIELSANAPSHNTVATQPAVTVATQIKAIEASKNPLLNEGRRLLASGDVEAARALFESAANQGMAEAALALGSTYDAKALANAGMKNIVPDRKLAIKWYRRAFDLANTANRGSTRP